MTNSTRPVGDVTNGSTQENATLTRPDPAGVSLTPEQRTAIEWMTAGETALAAATAAGVNRTTVYRWMKSDPQFQAAYNAWQNDVLATAKARLVAATDVAVTAVVNGMARGDAKTALTLLKQLGLLRPSRPGHTDPDRVAEDQQNDRHREEIQRFNDQDNAFAGTPRRRKR